MEAVKKYSIKLTDAKGSQMFVEIQTDEKDISIIANSLAAKLMKFYKMVKKYKAKTGFYFNRRFKIEFIVENSTVNSMYSKLGLTMFKPENVLELINDLTLDAFTTLGEDELIDTKEEVLEIINEIKEISKN